MRHARTPPFAIVDNLAVPIFIVTACIDLLMKRIMPVEHMIVPVSFVPVTIVYAYIPTDISSTMVNIA